MLIYKNTLLKIKKSLGRFLSLILIVALGSAFFAGVRETSSDMIKTMDEYYDETSLMDFKVVSTMGLTESDLNALKELKNSKTVEGTYTLEVEINGDATKIYGITENVNKLTLLSGRLPENDNECVVFEGTFNIGDTINVPDRENLKYTSLTVVGIVRSSMYIYKNLGTSSVSDGKLDNVIYIPKSNFTIDYYTEIYLIAKGSQEKTSYLDSYTDALDSLNNELEALKPIQETKRYEELKTELTNELYKAKDNLDEEILTNDQKFSDAKKEIDKNQLQITSGLNKIKSALEELEATKTITLENLNNEENSLNEALLLINENLNNYNISIDTLNEYLENLSQEIDNLKNILNNLESDTEEYLIYYNELKNLQEMKNTLEEINTQIAEINAGLNTITEGKNTLLMTYEENKALLNSEQSKLNQAQETLNKSIEEYNQNYYEYTNKITEAKQELINFEIEINSLEKPTWYLLNRDNNSGYTSFLESSTKIDSISAVFPIFFIAIAFLMCLNTMTRMIEEERTEIGTFTSLGISKFKITLSYLLYIFITTIIGLIVGLFIGYTIIPHILYNIYNAQFIIPKLNTYVNIGVCITIIEVCILTMSIVTIYTVNKNFKFAPAILLRPASPKNGKKVLLERITFIWKRVSFSWKVTLRNLFRYKKRIIMTLIGISGCTALLLTGFGIKDSISKLLDVQFKEIETYDATLVLKDSTTEINPEINTFLNSIGINNPLYANMQTLTFNANSKDIDIYAYAFENNDISTYFKLKDNDNNPLELSDKGVIITEKMAELLNAEVNSTITLRNSDNEIFILKVIGISKNYINNYVYMTKNYYETVFNDITYNTIITNLDNAENGTEILASNYFSTISYTEDNLDLLEDIIDGMNNIVFLIIAFSTFLAITVLYNLTSINISERTREIATLKVLGFNDPEVSMYVYRETILLTTIGIFIGLFLGVLLNNFVMSVAETDDLVFLKSIDISSYILTVIIIIIFTIFVQILTNFILKRINMIDSLKSVD